MRPLAEKPVSYDDKSESMDIEENELAVQEVDDVPEQSKQKVVAETIGKSNTAVPVEDFVTTELPKSLNEIYNMSNANKKNRSRDKKRNRSIAETPESSPAAVGAQAMANAVYFNKTVPVLASDGPVEEAVCFIIINVNSCEITLFVYYMCRLHSWSESIGSMRQENRN